MRTITTIMSIGACVVAVLTTTGCNSSNTASPSPDTSTSSPTPETATPPPTPDAATEEQPAQQWTMPNLVGATLQDAQDQIQSLTAGAVYFTDSHDLTGEDRNQMLDANWQVCSQNVAPGDQLTSTSQIDFGVVKLDESCP